MQLVLRLTINLKTSYIPTIIVKVWVIRGRGMGSTLIGNIQDRWCNITGHWQHGFSIGWHIYLQNNQTECVLKWWLRHYMWKLIYSFSLGTSSLHDSETQADPFFVCNTELTSTGISTKNMSNPAPIGITEETLKLLKHLDDIWFNAGYEPDSNLYQQLESEGLNTVCAADHKGWDFLKPEYENEVHEFYIQAYKEMIHKMDLCVDSYFEALCEGTLNWQLALAGV
ncbi:hypothetical protein BDR04DRAFT_1116419 [Suillus decipiens]|nr:hypothetical protein BDR04DRAFT_1116419 [Suillus decipiens]